MIGLVIVFVLLLLPLLWFVGTYNGLIRLRNHCNESWSNIDTELTRRHDLIPNLVRTVQAYAAHEQEVLASVTAARNSAIRTQSSAGPQSGPESQLAEALSRLLIRVEAYPDLKADHNFRDLQTELIRTEDRIQHVRRIFNANVRDFNNRVQMFPSNWVASMAGFTPRDYFEISDLTVRTVPSVS